MLVISSRSSVSFLFVAAVIVTFLIYSFPSIKFQSPELPASWSNSDPLGVVPADEKQKEVKNGEWEKDSNSVKQISPIGGLAPAPEAPPSGPDPDLETHHVVYSATTANKKYFHIDLGGPPAINPNIIPHPHNLDTYIVVARSHKKRGDWPHWMTEWVCDATFQKGELKCIDSPLILPIAATPGIWCEGQLAPLNWNVGPHDARVFFGPDKPYAVFGSNSRHVCFGQFIQDFRMLYMWPYPPPLNATYRYATDMQRPPPYGIVEKNWFPFWDAEGTMYMHHDLAPKRVFTKFNLDGSVGDDLAPAAKSVDEACWNKHAPSYVERTPDGYWGESIHQATNSLAVTMCKRKDTDCKAEDNTYIMHVFQKKIWKNFHGVYEPYVLLFKQTPPFSYHAISAKPIWFHGRKKANEDPEIAKDQTEMVYVTSMNWRTNGTMYHGYMDDLLMVGFGIEDQNIGGMDLTAEDLMGPLNLCDGGSSSSA